MYAEDKHALLCCNEQHNGVMINSTPLYEVGRHPVTGANEQEKHISQMVSMMRQAKVNTLLRDAVHAMGVASVAVEAIDKACHYTIKLIKKGNG